MRLVRVLVPDDRREDVVAVLDDVGVDYVRTREADLGDASLYEFPLPPQAVESVLADLRDAGLEEEYVVVVSAETARTPGFGELEERFLDGTEADESIAPEEIRARALDLSPNRGPYYAMTLLSALVATVGLLLDSPALVVGSMVIAPQVGSALKASVGAVLADEDMVTDGLSTQAASLALAVASATAFGFLLKTLAFVPATLEVATVSQISQRISPGVPSVVVGVCAGAAGALGLATALPVSLVGVMIAAALIPAAAAVGVGFAWGYPAVAFGALVLLVMNASAINVAGPATLWTMGYRPDGHRANGGNPGTLARLRQSWSAVLAVLAVVVLAVGAGSVLAAQTSFENEVNVVVEETLDRPDYRTLELLEVRVQFGSLTEPTDAERVTVVVARPADRPFPAFASTLRAGIADATGRAVPVEVVFTDRVIATGDGRDAVRRPDGAARRPQRGMRVAAD